MKKLLSVVLSLALALSPALCAALAEEPDDAEFRKRIATPIPTEEHFTLPEPQDLATLFPNDEILTYTNGGTSISYPSSFKLREAWGYPNSQWICLFTITDDAGNTLSLYMMNSDKEPAFSEDYEAYATKELVESLTRDEHEINNLLSLAPDGEYYPQYYSIRTTEFAGLSGTEALLNYADFGENAVRIMVTGGSLPHGVELRIRLPMPTAGKGYYEFDITMPNVDDREAITQCVALSSVLNTLKWYHNTEK